jgi:exosortase
VKWWRFKRWSPVDAALLTALVAVALYATRGAWADVVEQATRDQEQTHILLALPVVLWLGFLRRGRLHGFRPKTSPLGPLLMLGGWGLSLFGFSKSFDLFWHIGAISVVVGAVVTMLGPRIVSVFMPSFVALLFLLPVPGRFRGPIAGELQNVSAVIAEFGLDVLGIEIMREGAALVVNGKEVLIAEACNGMRMVSALALIAFAFIFSVPMRNSVRLAILAISPLVALSVNVIRLIPTALMYGYSTEDAASLFHDISGWVVLLLALGMLWAFLSLLRWIEVPIAPYPIAKAQMR